VFQTPTLILKDNIEVLRNFQIQILEKLVLGFESLPLKLLEKCPDFDSSVFVKLKSLRQKLKAKLKLTGALLKRKNLNDISFISDDDKDITENLVSSGEQSEKSSEMHISNLVTNNDKICRRLSAEVTDPNEDDEFSYRNDNISSRLLPEDANFEEEEEEEQYFNGVSLNETSAVKTQHSGNDNYSSLVSENKPLLNTLSSAQDVNSTRNHLASFTASLTEEKIIKPPTKVAFKFKTPTSFAARSASATIMNMNVGSLVSLNDCVSQVGVKFNHPSLESPSGLQGFQRNHEIPPRFQLSTTKSEHSMQQSDCNCNKPANQWVTSFTSPIVEAQSPGVHSCK
jgi:hypothetical protein